MTLEQEVAYLRALVVLYAALYDSAAVELATLVDEKLNATAEKTFRTWKPGR